MAKALKGHALGEGRLTALSSSEMIERMADETFNPTYTISEYAEVRGSVDRVWALLDAYGRQGLAVKFRRTSD